jgi:hypothetical protein
LKHAGQYLRDNLNQTFSIIPEEEYNAAMASGGGPHLVHIPMEASRPANTPSSASGPHTPRSHISGESQPGFASGSNISQYGNSGALQPPPASGSNVSLHGNFGQSAFASGSNYSQHGTLGQFQPDVEERNLVPNDTLWEITNGPHKGKFGNPSSDWELDPGIIGGSKTASAASSDNEDSEVEHGEYTLHPSK